MIEIKTYSPQDTKVKALVYGASGVGKTTFPSDCKNVIYASAENGLLSIASKGVDYVQISKFTDLQELYIYLAKNTGKYETLVVDSITEVNEVCKNDIEQKTGRKMQLQDWGDLGKKMRDMLRKFRDLPMNVLFIAQEVTQKSDETITRYVPNLNGKLSEEVPYFMDIVGYMYINKDGERKIRTQKSDKVFSKDRTGLITDETPLSFQAWIDLAKGIKVVKEKVKDSFVSNAIEDADLPFDENTLQDEKIIK